MAILCVLLLTLALFPHGLQGCEQWTPAVEEAEQNMTKSLNGDLDPSVFVSLRLLNYTLEQKFVTILKKKVISDATELTSGQLSLYILALIASCENTMNMKLDDSGTDHGTNLGEVLSGKLAQEIKNIEMCGYPVTTYYQVGLSFLALCKQSYRISKKDVKTFFWAVKQNKFSYGQIFSVDTAAIAALAFRCMQQDYKPADIIRNATIQLVMQILHAQDPTGIIGNTYSTGVAMQALIANQELIPLQRWNCSNTLREVLEKIKAGAFMNPVMASQVLPPTQGKTYLDVNSLSCNWAGDSPRSKHSRVPLSAASEALLEVRKSSP